MVPAVITEAEKKAMLTGQQKANGLFSLYPSLYQINTRVWLTELSRKLGKTATLDDIPDSELDRLAGLGFEWIWLLSVWQTGMAGQRVSRSNPEWREEFQQTLPDLHEEDIAGSGFAVTSYTVHENLGGNDALVRLRDRLQQRGLRLILDFVPNHTALDHHWVSEHPEYYVLGTERDLVQTPQNYIRLEAAGGRIFAYGRDPYFPGWPDTLQLNYGNPAAQEALLGELTRIAGLCDGVRCDMAMLVLPEVFERTWRIKSQPFWPRAVRLIRTNLPNFRFMAEVYWDLEWTLQQQGFDYTYDKRLYDRLREGHARPVREHLFAGLDYQTRMARFLENHDEPRAATTFPTEIHKAAAVITYFSPGMRFFHQGQLQGCKKRISPHLVRGPAEPVDDDIQNFYQHLLPLLERPLVRNGQWKLLETVPAWDGNGSWDAFVAFAWHSPEGERLLAAVNYAPHPSQCYVRLPFTGLIGSYWRLRDLLSSTVYDRDGQDLECLGLYLDVPAWRYHLFDFSKLGV